MNYKEMIKDMVRGRIKELWEQMVDEAPDFEDAMELFEKYNDKSFEIIEAIETMIEGAEAAEMLEPDEAKEIKMFASDIREEFEVMLDEEYIHQVA